MLRTFLTAVKKEENLAFSKKVKMSLGEGPEPKAQAKGVEVVRPHGLPALYRRDAFHVFNQLFKWLQLCMFIGYNDNHLITHKYLNDE